MSESFETWLCREMPAGTVISDPKWWAPKILRAVAAEQPQVLADLAMVVRQLCTHVKMGHPARERAYALLRKHDLMGSPMRIGAQDAQQGQWTAEQCVAYPQAAASLLNSRAAVGSPGMARVLRELSVALGHPADLESETAQSSEEALVELAIARLKDAPHG